MSSEIPPTYYFSGITYNPSFYPSSSTGDYLTETTGKKLFLTYPFAQGPETISTINCSVINSSSETSNLDLGSNMTLGTISIGNAQESGSSIVIGNNNNSDTQIKGGTIRLLNNTNVTGRIYSAYLESLEFDSNLAIAETQTMGVLEIANSSSRNGDIEFAKNATNGILSIGSNSNEGTQIRGQPIELFNDTNVTGEFFTSGSVTANSYNLSGAPPTLTKLSLGYFVNYTKTSASFSASNRFLYSPASNTSTTDSNYLEAGVYMANIHMYAVAAAGQTYSNTFQIGIAAGTSIQTLVNNSQYGTMVLTSGDLVSINAGANTTGNNFVFSHSGCFTLTSSSFVYLEFWLRGQSGATQTYNLSGCIYRIA